MKSTLWLKRLIRKHCAEIEIKVEAVQIASTGLQSSWNCVWQRRRLFPEFIDDESLALENNVRSLVHEWLDRAWDYKAICSLDVCTKEAQGFWGKQNIVSFNFMHMYSVYKMCLESILIRSPVEAFHVTELEVSREGLGRCRWHENEAGRFRSEFVCAE